MKNKFLTSDFSRALIWAADRALDHIYVGYYHIALTKTWRSHSIHAFLKALIMAKNRGIDVRVILNYYSVSKGSTLRNVSTARFLSENNVPVRRHTRPFIIHSKMFIADSNTIICGSHNLSYSALYRNFEASILCSDEGVVLEATRLFLHLWNNCIDFFPLPGQIKTNQ